MKLFNNERELSTFFILSAIFVGVLTISNVLAFKLFQVTPLLVAPAGVIAYSITFICTDVLVEMFGKARAKIIITIGFITQLIVLVLMRVAVILPPASGIFEHQSEFELVLSQGSRIVFASLVAYFVAQLFDVSIFSWIKQKTDGKFLWLRNNGSTMLSQLLDSIIFVIIAFGGVFAPAHIVEIIIGQYLIKLIIAAIDTPIVYVVVALLKNKLGLESFREGDAVNA